MSGEAMFNCDFCFDEGCDQCQAAPYGIPLPDEPAILKVYKLFLQAERAKSGVRLARERNYRA